MSSLRRCLQTISRVLRYISPVFFLLLIFPAAAQEAEFTPPPNSDIETLTELIVPEDPAHILDLNVWDTDVSLFLSGYWKGTLGGNLGLSLTPLGMTAASTDSPILFTQETDISLSLWIKERWFVEASFLDEYAMNTFRAGYQGISGEFIQYVGIGNTGLDFPVYPYLDLGGSSGASPGIYGRFGTDTLTIHSMFRYDAAVRESRVYVGERERTYSYISVENSVRGRSFVLPDDDLDSIPIVYIEDSEGTYRGSDKRRYRIAENSELAASRAYGIIELANSPEGRVAVSYTKGSNTPWDISMGNYSDTQGSSFLGNVQHHFSGYPLTQYTQPGQEDASKHIPGTITISINGNTVSALIVYEPGTFSPFERQSRYDAPSSNTSTADLVTLSTEERIGGYEVLPLDSLLTTSDVQLDLEDQPQREMYELTKYGDYGNRRSAESRWPLTEISKEIYLPIRQDNNEDMSIRFTNYGNSGAYSLGTDIVPGSVKVYRGEIEDPRFTFDAESGVVALEYPAAFNEVVRITYLRQNNQRDFVSFAGGIGADYHPGGPFSSSIALGFRWNNNDSAFSEAALSNQGTVGLSGQAAWSEENFNANISAGAVIDQPDSSGLYRIAGMEGASKIIELSASNSFISEVPEDPLGTLSSSVLTDQNRAALIYRNYSESSLLGSSLHPIEWNNAEIVSTEEGPYPVRDNAVDSDILAAEFSLSNEKIWAGFQSPLGDDHGLNNAEQIDIPIRLYDFDTQLPSDFTITVQFGALKDQEDQFGENPQLIVTKTIQASEIDFTDYFLKSIVLTNAEQGKLKDANYMRVFIDGQGNNISGRILVAPPIIWGASFRPIEIDGSNNNAVSQSFSVGIKEAIDASLRSKYSSTIDQLHPNNITQRVLNVTWDKGEANTAFGADTRVPWIPLINYDTLSFFAKAPKPKSGNLSDAEILARAEMHFIITQGPSALFSSGKTRLAVSIPASAFVSDEWSKVEITYNGSSPELSVSGKKIDGATITYNPNQEYFNNETDLSGRQSYLAFFLKPADGDFLPEGEFSIDEIMLEHSISSYRFNAGAAFDWKIPGTILSLGTWDLLKDVTIQSAAESTFRASPEQENIEHFAGLQNYSKITGTVLDTLLSADLRIHVNPQDVTWNAGYEIDRDFGPLSFNDTFLSGSAGESLWHDVSLELATIVTAGIEASTEFADGKLDRIWETYAGFNPFKNNNSGISADFYANWLSYNEDPAYWSASFGDTWLHSWEAALPDAGWNADRRNTKLSVTGTIDTKPVGARMYLEGESLYNKIQSTTFSNSVIRLEVPFTIGETNAMFQLERGFNWGLNLAGNSLHDDSRWFMNSLNASAPLWASIPFYSLFDPNLFDSMQSVYNDSTWKSNTDNSQFRDLAELSVQFPPARGLLAFFIPSAFEASLNRSLHQKLDTISDVLNLNAAVDFIAVNLFGAFGSVPIMPFYQSDEFSTRLEGSIAFPRNEDFSWQLLAGQSMAFFGFAEAILIVDNTLTFTDEGWAESVKIDWLVPTKKSPLSLFYHFLMGKALDQELFPALSDLALQPFSQLRNETLELSITESEGNIVMGFDLRHESIIRLEGRLNFSVFAELSTLYYSATDILSFIGTIGTTLNISF